MDISLKTFGQPKVADKNNICGLNFKQEEENKNQLSSPPMNQSFNEIEKMNLAEIDLAGGMIAFVNYYDFKSNSYPSVVKIPHKKP